jgi:alpha-mannosidase
MNQRSHKTGRKIKSLQCVFYISLLVVIIVCSNAKAGKTIDSQLSEGGTLRLVSVKPTVFFIKEKGALLQVVEVNIENTSEPVEASLDVRLDGKQKITALGKVKKGKATFHVHIPDIAEPKPVEFVLKAKGKVQNRSKSTWQPKRHWQVYIVPITHHDLGYTDTIENVLNLYGSFYDDVLRFCEETDDWPEESKYRYTLEGTWSIQHFIENRPKEVVDKFGKYIKNGRIEVGALFGNEISALCSHEQLIRLMYPSFRLKRKYGAQIRTGSITDVPGLSWGLPTVLAGAGVKYFFAGLPTYFEWGRSDIHTFWDESAILRHGRPDAFRWQGPDGETVLVYYHGSYGFFKAVTGPHTYKYVMDNLPDMLEAMEKQGTPFDVARYIHNGVDNYPPDVEISHIAKEWNSRWAYPKIIVATNSMFFEALEKQCGDVRTFRGELPHTDYVVGAISTAKQTSINRLTHDRLHSAEKFATIASLASDYTYPSEKIRQAYDNVLLYDEHTWGKDYPAGKLQDWAWNEKSHYAYKAAGLTKPILSRSLDRIANKIELKEQGRHIVVFNSLSFRRTDVVRLTRFDVKEPFDLIDEETGQKVPYQIVEMDSPQDPVPYAAYRYARGQFENKELFELAFVAEGVPSIGHKTYRLEAKEKAAGFSSSVVVGENSMENRFFKIKLDPQTGAVESIYDKELSRELVDKQAPHKLNQFVARWVQTGKQESPKKAKIRKGQSSPVYGSLVVSSQGAGCPQLTQEIILYDKIKRIDFANRILKDSTPLLELYFAFPFKTTGKPDFRFEGSNSVIKPLRDQFPGSNSNYYAVQHWADVSDGKAGVTLSCVDSHLLEFGGLWPCYVSQAHHGVTPPDFGREFVKQSQLTKGYMYSFVLDNNFRTNFQPVQQGDMLFRYSITTHEKGWKEGDCRDFGWAICNPLVPVQVNGKKKGTLDRKMSFCQVDKPNVFVLTLKRAEDGDGIIVRLIETKGKDVTATLTLPHLTIKQAYRTNLVEENKEKAIFTEHTITAPIKAFGITTIRFQT